MSDTPTGRRVCAHAGEDGRGMHFLDSGETCLRDTRAAVQALREHLRVMGQLADQLDSRTAPDEATVIAWADSATEIAGRLRALARPSLTLVPDAAS